MGQVPTVLRQPPQRQASLSPTRRTPGVRYEVGSCAISAAIAAKNAKTSLRLDRRGRGSNADDLRARVLQAHLSWNKTNDGSKQQNEVADPDPGDEREDVHLKNGFGVVGQNAGIIDVEIFVQ